MMITVVLGAPGSGKSTVTPLLGTLLPGCIVMDWDVFMEPAAQLAGRDIRSHPETWPGYRQLMRTALETMSGQRVLMLGVGAPDDLEGWPVSSWLVLDCTDQERRRRLTQAGRAADAQEAVADAAEYRSLGLPVIDTTALTPEEVASEIARLLSQMWCAVRELLVRRTAEGRTKKEILRCLKRYIAREAYPSLTSARG
jgi:hypothetical protein